ncbi:allantoate amidohydrolase [Jiangella alkaliphila]|uniref:N-carbamoyl-L-amino-acid hydrolase n=1 Tax=Jiangella alkaliphila TaxID=419479 RepID=A0A1H2GGI1_9ACTN|nr:allantoate amidohydrolase [Jiangella alkaliphila]SDU18705.1 N-carbamoyl-L-amino-acid hydrolase [Jiangella alkaliphila]
MIPSFDAMWADLEPVGRDPRGGYRRFAWTDADALLREWFAAEAARRGLAVTVDRSGNQWAWWGEPSAGTKGVVAGSHLDSVPSGGAFDGPLGVVSAFAAVDLLRERGHAPARPIGIVNFGDEEGARFGVACAGSRLVTGALPAGRALGLTDADGVSLAQALGRHGRDPDAVGPDPEALERVGAFVELHVEQGRGLVYQNAPIGVATEIWPHGRWRVTLAGEANHAGTTPLADRSDPMLDLAALVTEARAAATRHGVLATVGKVEVDPNGVNAIPSQVRAWLDCRGADPDAVAAVIADLGGFGPQSESWTAATVFDPALAARLSGVLGNAPLLPTGAGHDAGILSAAGIPTAMLFVRNPTGVSHSPAEFAERSDCHAGVAALADVLAELTR